MEGLHQFNAVLVGAGLLLCSLSAAATPSAPSAQNNSWLPDPGESLNSTAQAVISDDPTGAPLDQPLEPPLNTLASHSATRVVTEGCPRPVHCSNRTGPNHW
jgi:hypothetical protein